MNSLNAAVSTTIDVPMSTPHQAAERVFRVVFAVDVLLTAYWLLVNVTGRSSFFGTYRPTWDNIFIVVDSFLIGVLAWGLIWYALKRVLLRRFVGFSQEDCDRVFSSRMTQPFELATVTAGYSERRIRIVDMISRRGRTLMLALGSFFLLYRHIALSPSEDFVTLFLGDQLLDAVVTGWVFLLVYRADGLIGKAVYGSQARVMDGVLARANCLVSMTLWTVFKFVFVPLGGQLAEHYEPQHFAVVFALIWGAYLTTDAAAEIGGSLFGRQRIRVMGLGDLNRKSIGGTVTGLVTSLLFCVGIVTSQGLAGPWLVLAVCIAVSSTLVELFSPRSTDDFTMAITNALICWAFGALIL